MFRDVFQCEVEVLKEFHSPSLMAGNFLWLTEVLEVFMVHADDNGVVSA
jgi:hypothetical protein